MLIRTVLYQGYDLALKKENNLFQVSIYKSGGGAATSTGLHIESESALQEARAHVDALVNQWRQRR